MKRALFIVLGFTLSSFAIWETDFEAAKHKAKEKHELILLNFSGSDWCGPCIRLQHEVFESAPFLNMADAALILVNADFPRNRKHQLPQDIKKQNEALAEKYNPSGKFPFTVLLDANGSVIRSWDGLPKEDAVAFSKEIKDICDANRK